MNLKNKYSKNKQSGIFAAFILSGVVALGIIFGMNLLWNYVSPVWGLPKLTYLEFLSTLFLISMSVQFLGLKATKGSANPYIDVVKIIGEPPYGKQ